MLGDFSEANRRIGANAWLFIVGGLGEVLEQLAVDGAVRKLCD